MADLPNVLLDTVVEASKRQTVAAACQQCRLKKSKCDGGRPCKTCARRGTECIYETGLNETRQQAGKRKFGEVSQSYEESNRVLQELVNSDEGSAWAALQRLRSGQSVAAVASQLQKGRVFDPVASSYEQQLQQNAVIALCQSSGSLDDLVNMAPFVLSSTTRMNLLGQASHALKGKIVNIELLTNIISGSHGTLRLSEEPEDLSQVHYYYVPADPWTEVTTSSEAVSYLVSTFLRFGNGYWRFVEEDLFLRAMRSRKPSSEYCSPLLVNAICAWASTYSEIDEAFKVPGQYVTRGNHFFEEARRLWRLEGNRVSITNTWALLIMAVDSAMRGKDPLAPTFCKAAVTALNTLPAPDPEKIGDRNKASRQNARARCTGAAGVIWEEYSNVIGLMRPIYTINVTTKLLPDLHFLPDREVYWTGHPFIDEPMKFRPNLLTRERRNLTVFMEELINTVNPGNAHSRTEILMKAADLGDRMTAWYKGLTADLLPARKIPAPLFEFNVQYCGLIERLYNRAWISAFGDSESAAVENVDDSNEEDSDEETVQMMQHARAQFPKLALEYAYKGATLLRDYRKLYGMKICIPYLVQHAAESIFILLLDLPHAGKATIGDDDQAEERPIDNTQDAFTECFRTLLGSGVQIMLPRAITRMVFHTAAQFQIQLPPAVERMLSLVASTGWEISDVEVLNSIWPNLPLRDRADGADQAATAMGELLRKWEKMNVDDAAT